MQIQYNVSLKKMNTLGIEANASHFVAIQTIKQLRELCARDVFQSNTKFVLGGGSNILFTKDFAGLVIKNEIKEIKILDETDDHVWLQAGGGESWHGFVMFCLKHNYAGIENLSLIPGTVGAAPIQNIGAYGVELKDYFVQLEALDLQNGSLHTFTHADCQFGYRESIFKNEYKNRYIILQVILRLNKKPVYHVDYGQIQETLKQMQVKELSIKSISDAVIQIRRSKLPDPNEIGNAGSFFKNPIVTAEHFQALQKTFPQVPAYHIENSQDKKISAGWLIEQCGWKGKRFGNIGVYDKQALILVNYGSGTAQEIKDLADKIQHSVKKEFDIWLTPEVNFV